MITFEKASEFFSEKIFPAFLLKDAQSLSKDILLSKAGEMVSNPIKYPVKEIKDILLTEHIRLGASTETLEKIKRINDKTLFIIAGQQAGLFGGPLYTFYKAAHILKLAELIVRETGYDVLPVFWTASDDHDFEEVSHYGIQCQDGTLKEYSYNPDGRKEGTPVGEIVIDKGISDIISGIGQNLKSGRTDQFISIIADCWLPGEKWADAFNKTMLKIFEKNGLVLIDPRWNGVKKLFTGVYLFEVENPLASTGIVNKAAYELKKSSGKSKPLHKPENSVNLFMEVDGIRTSLTYGPDAFKAGNKVFSKNEISALIKSEPERFSPSAVLRPLCQDSIFPAICTVGGPGERVYLSQTENIYDIFGIRRSLVWPRASFTIIDKKTRRTALKENIALQELFYGIENIRSSEALKSYPEHLKSAFMTTGENIGRSFSELITDIEKMDKTLAESVKKEKNKVLHIIGEIEEKTRRVHKALSEVSEKRFSAAVNFISPNGIPQERWFGSDIIYSSFDHEEQINFIQSVSPGEEHHRFVIL